MHIYTHGSEVLLVHVYVCPSATRVLQSTLYICAGCKKEEFPVEVPCVDTYRNKPKVVDY